MSGPHSSPAERAGRRAGDASGDAALVRHVCQVRHHAVAGVCVWLDANPIGAMYSLSLAQLVEGANHTAQRHRAHLDQFTAQRANGR